MPQHVPAPQLTPVPPPLPQPLVGPVQTRPRRSEPPRRIVFLAHRGLGNPAAGGSEVLIDRIASGLTEFGHDVTLLCGGTAAPRPYRVVSAGGPFGHFAGARSAFARHVGSCDLLVEVCNGMPYLAPLWHDGPTVCLVNHVHTDLWGMRFPRPVARAGRLLEHWALARAHRGNLLAAVSPSTEEALRTIGVPPERIRVVHNGVHEPAPRTPRSATPLFVALGRLVDYKRIDLLLRLWERVRPVTGGRLVVIGDGPERDRLERLAGAGVEFTGQVSEEEKHRLLCEAWLLLHPAAVEGWGLVVTEAGARGTPTLGFDVPGLRDSVRDGVTGVLARGESSFAAAWCTLALDTARREDMGEAAARHAAAFRWSGTVRQFRAIASEAVERSRPRGRGGPAEGARR
ncbi:glycosyltransferase family 4 protein [Streptomyces sp. CS081A]|uniref:glycosyltransferase family 4 protein n=1 Tax=Streptomyces TaxID=1883 RepID=UPI000D5231FE|nr:glycosyltransferase family 4 protein [Streptomyces sp. CS081A]PVC68272.1 glycosyl transferase [Streptomyces sp. CS081A]